MVVPSSESCFSTSQIYSAAIGSLRLWGASCGSCVRVRAKQKIWPCIMLSRATISLTTYDFQPYPTQKNFVNITEKKRMFATSDPWHLHYWSRLKWNIDLLNIKRRPFLCVHSNYSRYEHSRRLNSKTYSCQSHSNTSIHHRQTSQCLRGSHNLLDSKASCWKA